MPLNNIAWTLRPLTSFLLTANLLIVMSSVYADPSSQPAGETAAQQVGQAEAENNTAAGDSRTVVSKNDYQMMRELAQANLAQIKMSALAAAISQKEDIRKYAEIMLNEHYAANDRLQKLADSHKVILPHGVDEEQAQALRKLVLMAGPDFDRAYLSVAGAEHHDRTQQLIQRATTEAQDERLKAYAATRLPMIGKHQALARQLAGSPEPAGGVGN